MSVYDQPITTYSDTTPHIRVISNVIQMIDPTDTPLIAALGLDSARGKFNVRLNGYKVELLEDSYDPLTDTVSSGLSVATTATNFTVADASIYQDGHVLLIEAEYMVVKAVDTTANTVTVYSRSYGGTNALHADASAIEIVGMARLEGDDADYGPVVDITAPYNYTSIFQKGVKATGSMQAISQYGIDDEFMYQSNKAVPHLMRLVEKSLFHGVRDAGTAAAPRSAGGLGTFITDNTVAAGGAIAKSDVDNLMEEIVMDGGNPDLLVLSPRIANDLRALIDSSSFVRVGQENTVLGMRPIVAVNTQYGPLRMIESRWCPTSTAYALDSRKVGVYTLRPFASHALAKTGDSVKGEVITELSLLVANDKSHGKITGITT